MKLFDLNRSQEREFKLLALWHAAYMGLIALFFGFIYYFGYFKSNRFLREDFIFIILGPVCTALFILLSPWRTAWRDALENTYSRLEGEPVFCLMAALVFGFGFFIYSVLLWGLGALGPSLFYF